MIRGIFGCQVVCISIRDCSHLAYHWALPLCLRICSSSQQMTFLFCYFHSNHRSLIGLFLIHGVCIFHLSLSPPLHVCLPLISSSSNLLLCRSTCYNGPADGGKEQKKRKGRGKQWARSKDMVWQNERKTDSKWDREREKTYFGSID